MKKITTIFKTIDLAVVVLVMMQSCIPNTPVINPIPQSGSFDVNINDLFLNPGQNEISSKVVLIDGDSIFFSLERNYIFVDGWEFLNIYAQSKSGQQYEFYASKTNNDEGNCMLAAGVSVGNIPDADHM